MVICLVGFTDVIYKIPVAVSLSVVLSILAITLLWSARTARA